MHITNTESYYGIISILFHWIMAVLVIGMILVGLYMVRIPDNPEKLYLIGLHKEFGVLILGLVALRLLWRFSNKMLLMPASIPKWQVVSANAVHYMLYGCMFLLPITGCLLSSAAGFPISFFGLFVLPTIGAPNPELRSLYTLMHHWIAYGLILLILVHTAAALMHHYIDRDNILRRMLPWS